jgi:SAM-dependent methyltransferase
MNGLLEGDTVMAETQMPLEERLLQVLHHLGVARVHVAGGSPADVAGVLRTHPDLVASLTLVCPARLPPQAVQPCADRLLVIVGDQGAPAAMVRQAVAALPGAAVVTLPQYFSPPWADAVADRTDAVGSALLRFLETPERSELPVVDLAPGEGEVAGITYRVQGRGRPLLLLPLNLASTQWDALVDQLSARFCTITLGGPELGFVTVLETRGQAWGYVSVVRTLIDEVHLRPGDTILDVGCGSGVLDRWLAHYTQRQHAITGVDINRYLLREATALAQKDAGLGAVLTFRAGRAEALPFPDHHFDVVLSLTVLEEGDADAMLADMVRVTKPGGRVAAMVRAFDIPWFVHAPLPPALKTKAEIPRGFVDARGCADASLGKRLLTAGLTQVKMFPQFTLFDDLTVSIGQFQQAAILGALDAAETQEWHAGVRQAVADGTFYIAQSHHCAVGIKP